MTVDSDLFEGWKLVRGEGMTVQEIMVETGRSKAWVTDRIKRAVKDGELEVVWKDSTRIDGRPFLVPAYRAKGRKNDSTQSSANK